MPGKNAVIKRIDLLTKAWQRFADDSDARILRLRLTTDAGRLLDAFLAYHNEEQSDLTDLFQPIVVPCLDAKSYWNDVREQLLLDIENAKGELESLEIPTDWQPPAEEQGTQHREGKAPAEPQGTTRATSLIATLASFQVHYHELFEHVALVLLPAEISSRELWIECMDQLVACHAWPESVRVIVPDWLPETILHDWSVKHSSRVTTVTPRLDMPGLPLELLAHLPGSGPGFEFRRLFMQLSAAASTGQIAQIPRLAQSALGISNAHGWLSLSAVVHLVVAAGMSACGQSKEVLEAYRTARQMALKATDPSAPKVAIVSAMGEGGTLLGAGNYREARQVYLEAARDADQGAEAMSSMDARRMASFCAEANGDFDAAWDDAQAALSIARSMPADARRSSTLPALLHRMEEMARKPEMMVRNVSVQRECRELLGSEWTGILDRTRSLLT